MMSDFRRALLSRGEIPGGKPVTWTLHHDTEARAGVRDEVRFPARIVEEDVVVVFLGERQCGDDHEGATGGRRKEVRPGQDGRFAGVLRSGRHGPGEAKHPDGHRP